MAIMYALDFEYAGQYLSDFGFIICDFDSSSGANSASAGSHITFNTVPRHRGKKHGLIGTQYDECIKTTFDICKDPDIHDDLEITNDEYRDIVRWLNRPEFLDFRVLYENENDPYAAPCHYEATFNIEKIKIAEKLSGLRLSMETNAPFGYCEEVVYSWDITNAPKTVLLNDMSDELGTTYPLVTITCHADGNLQITNKTESNIVSIKNCKYGEVITLNGDTQIIATSYSSHDICNDFNYEFLKIGNTFDNRDNEISVSMPCKLEIRYCPIIKDSP